MTDARKRSTGRAARRAGMGRSFASAIIVLATLLLAAVLLAGCGGSGGSGDGTTGSTGGSGGDGTTASTAGSGTGGDGASLIVEESGTIEAGDTRDPNHAGLPYDAYEFEADLGDEVVIEVSADGFIPLLKLVEVSTGAPLAEWEAEYSDDDALTYTIAGPGTYEARVYALEDGTGSYELTIRVVP